MAEQLDIAGGAALRTVAQIIDNDADFAVEFKVGPDRTVVGLRHDYPRG